MLRRAFSKWLACPEHIPRAYWRFVGWYRVVLTVCSALSVGVICLWFLRGFDSIVPVLFYAVLLIFMWIVPGIMKRRLQRKLNECGRLMCLECGYDLRHLETRKCPECGTPFDPNRVVARWTAWSNEKVIR